MAKVLKLDRISTYVSPAIENTRLERNETVRVDDKTAEYLLSHGEKGDGDTAFPHFVEIADPDGDYSVTYDIIVMKDIRIQAEREAKGIVSQLKQPPLRHERAVMEDADAQDARTASRQDDEPEAVPARRQRAAPVVAKKAARRLPARA